MHSIRLKEQLLTTLLGLFRKTLAFLYLKIRQRLLAMLLVLQLKMARKQAQVAEALELLATSAWEAAHLCRMQLRVLLWLRHKIRLQPSLVEMSLS